MSQPLVMAELFRIEVEQTEDGSTKCHSILYLPSDISERHVRDGAETPDTEEVFDISGMSVHSVNGDAGTVVERQISSISLGDVGGRVGGRLPISTNGLNDEYRMESTYNIVMVDTSDYMKTFFPNVMDSWNENIAESLEGVTDIYSFASEVHFKRSGTTLELRDKMGGASTNLTGAIKEIHFMIHECPHKHVRVFLVTGGAHTGTDEKPQVEIDKMSVPEDKRVEMFVLRIERSYPDDYSMQIRSKLHNGAAGIPTIFWAKEASDIPSQMKQIGIALKRAVKVSLSEPAITVPYLDTQRNSAYPGECLYFDIDPTVLRSKLRLTVEHEPKVWVPMNWRRALQRGDEFDRPGGFNRQGWRRSQSVPWNDMRSKEDANGASSTYELTIDDQITYIPRSVFETLYRQWNAVLIQLHTNRQTVPLEVFDLMKRSLKMHSERDVGNLFEGNGRQDARRKHFQRLHTLINTSYNIVSAKSKFKNELERVEAVLKTTVQSKYDNKRSKIKGHNTEKWEEDVEEFKLKLDVLRPRLEALPEPSPEESCRILLCSFIGDLLDTNICDVLKKHKLDFLQQMTFTGIPVHVPVKDYSQINPWTQHIKNICVSPYEILSQKSMETKIALEGKNNASDDKEIILRKNAPETTFNIIVPIIPRMYAEVLKPLVLTKVFAVGCTFCILKSATIVDYNCHIAALGCVWMKTIKDFPLETRPAYIKNRIADLEATARIYLDRHSIETYIECLLKKPEQALCTESAEKYNDVTVKCESLIKPAFFLHLSRHNYALLEECQAKIPIIIQRVVMEFLGRCLSSYKSTSPFVDIFLPPVSGDLREEWLKEKAEEIVKKIHLSDLKALQLGDRQQGVKRFLDNIFTQLDEYNLSWRKQITQDVVDTNKSHPNKVQSNPNFIVPNPNMDKIRNSGSAGQISINGLRAWAKEMLHDFGAPAEDPTGVSGVVPRTTSLTQDDVDYTFGEEMMLVYLVHALTHRKSRGRSQHQLPTVEEARVIVQEKLDAEWNRRLASRLRPKVEELLLKEIN